MNLEAMIQERGLKKRWVAEQIGVSPVLFSRILLGRRPLPANKIPALARALRYPAQAVRDAMALPINGKDPS